MWRKDKRGVSIMIGYVLLIVIAVALSVLVFAFLRLYVPAETPMCEDGVGIRIEEVNCSSGAVTFTIANHGLFTIDGVQIRAGEVDRIARDLLNEEDGYIIVGQDDGLQPDESWSYGYEYTELGVREIEFEPIQYIDNKPALCSRALAKVTTTCS